MKDLLCLEGYGLACGKRSAERLAVFARGRACLRKEVCNERLAVFRRGCACLRKEVCNERLAVFRRGCACLITERRSAPSALPMPLSGFDPPNECSHCLGEGAARPSDISLEALSSITYPLKCLFGGGGEVSFGDTCLHNACIVGMTDMSPRLIHFHCHSVAQDLLA